VWCDSHCHVPYEGTVPFEGGDRQSLAGTVVDQARAAGVTRLVTVGTDAAQSTACLALAADHEGVWATVGLHPHDASQGVPSIEALFQGQAKLVGVGECGLDYHYDLSPRPAQREAFAAQVELAQRLDLTLVVHTREAWDDTFAILKAVGAPERTIFHCFTGGPEEARAALDLGAWLSFSGIITFKNATDVREAAALCPLERLLVETDSPFLAPVPHRGQLNSPAWLPVVGAAVAAVKGVQVAEVEQATWSGAAAAFRLP
jgi:TatD DNase family protein